MKNQSAILKGDVLIELKGTMAEAVLNKLNNDNIPVWDITKISETLVRFHTFPGYLSTVNGIVHRTGCESDVVCVRRHGDFFLRLLARPVLLISIVFCVITSILLPRFVFFYEVVGNNMVEDEKILRELNDIGIKFGIYGPDIHPIVVKNKILNRIPELQWITITQNGCKATVTVRERASVTETVIRKGFSNIVAEHAGLITEMSVYTGQALVDVGDVVEKNQILVSGIIDLDRIYMVQNANAEIFARIWETKKVCIPSNYLHKTREMGKKSNIWLVWGDKRIKIFGNSGISHDSCDKMIKKIAFDLPEEYHIPVSVEIEQFAFYQSNPAVMPLHEAELLLNEYAVSKIEDQLRAGEILHSNNSICDMKDYYLLEATFECREMIARSMIGKWNYEDFLHD